MSDNQNNLEWLAEQRERDVGSKAGNSDAMIRRIGKEVRELSVKMMRDTDFTAYIEEQRKHGVRLSVLEEKFYHTDARTKVLHEDLRTIGHSLEEMKVNVLEATANVLDRFHHHEMMEGKLHSKVLLSILLVVALAFATAMALIFPSFGTALRAAGSVF